MTLADPLGPEAPGAPRLSPFERTRRIFTSPASAWADLAERGQWWFPLLVSLALWLALQGLTYQHITVPTMLEQWSKAVDSGSMQPEAMDKMSQFFTDNPAAPWIVVGQWAIIMPIMALLTALVLWFGTGFVLGTRLKYRQALDVVCWSGLVKIPAMLLFYALAWQKESFTTVHLGLGILVPESDTPSKLLIGVTQFLDMIGPFEAWQLAVAVLGAAALSGAPRRNVAWVLVALSLALGAFLAAIGALFSPGA